MLSVKITVRIRILKKEMVKPVFNFLEAEKSRVVAPKSCKRCAVCKSCSYQNDHVTWVKKKDLTETEKGLTYVAKEKRWFCQYAMLGDPLDYLIILMFREMHHELSKSLIENDHKVAFNEVLWG